MVILVKNKVIDILKNSEFSEDFITYVKNNFNPTYKVKFKDPYHREVEKNPLLDLMPQERLIESLAQLLYLKKYYVDKNIPLTYFYNSIYDLSYRLERYYKNEGIYGLSDRDLRWLIPLYKAEIFDLGSLRFQRFWFSNAEIERQGYDFMPLSDQWKKRLPEKTPVITIHILKDTDLSPDKIDESLDLARCFFKKYFSEHTYNVFVCRTWLLYPLTRDILAKDSNISAFSKRFEIIAKNQNTKQALDRIYGCSDLELIKKMDKHSSLEKTAYKNLDKLGVAAGIIYK